MSLSHQNDPIYDKKALTNHWTLEGKCKLHVNIMFQHWLSELMIDTGCLLTGVTEVLSYISLVFWARDLVLWINTVYYRAFDNQKMIWPLSPPRYFKWLCPKNFEKLENLGLWSMFFKNFNFEAFKGIFWPWCRKQKSLRIKFYPRKHPLKNILSNWFS